MYAYYIWTCNAAIVDTLHCIHSLGVLGVCCSEDEDSGGVWQLLVHHVPQCVCGGRGETRSVGCPCTCIAHTTYNRLDAVYISNHSGICREMHL